MEQRRIADSMVRKYGTRDPFRLAKELGMIVIRTPLQGIRGFYQHIQRCVIIYVDSALDARVARFVCAHEIGHALMHRGYNRIFMDTHTYFTTRKHEVESDRFAVDLLYDDEDLREFLEYPVELAADCMGVSVELAQYRLQQLIPENKNATTERQLYGGV